MTWEVCAVDNNYEIFTEYPYQIRKINNKRIIREYHEKNGYLRCNMNGKKYLKHRVIAVQWIENDSPETKTYIDHINHIRDDNHINNLRWVTQSENSENKASYNNVKATYLYELPDNCIPIEMYRGIIFENYFYCKDNGKCYYDNGVFVRELTVNKSGYGLEYVSARDIDNKSHNIYIKTWLREDALIE